MFIDYYFLRLCDKLRDSSVLTESQKKIHTAPLLSSKCSNVIVCCRLLFALWFIRYNQILRSSALLGQLTPGFSFFLFLSFFSFFLSLSGETRHVVSSHYRFVWYLKSASSLLGRAESLLTSEPGACVCVPACNWSTPPSGDLRWAETWDRGPPVCRQRHTVHFWDGTRTPVRGGNIMATTTCTRFTDEYQLYEELGK